MSLERVPPHLRDGLQRYIQQGIEPGHFLRAVMEHELFEAMGRADDESRVSLFGLVSYIYNEAPSGCHGTPDKVQRWIAHRGLAGFAQEKSSV